MAREAVAPGGLPAPKVLAADRKGDWGEGTRNLVDAAGIAQVGGASERARGPHEEDT